MHPRRLRQLVPTLLTAVGAEGAMLYFGRHSSLWRELFIPLHVVVALWVAFGVWSALRQRTPGRDRRRGERRSQARGGT